MNFAKLSKSLITCLTCCLVMAISVNAAQAGVIAHYSFDSDFTSDTGPNGLDLNLAGPAPSLVPGVFGNAVDFGSLGYLWSNHPAFNLATGPIAISLWYQADTDTFNPLVGKTNSISNTGYSVFHSATASSSALGGELSDGIAGVVGTLRPAGDTTSFQHIVWQNNGGVLELYVNSVKVSFASENVVGTQMESANAFVIGARNVASNGLGGTNLSDVKIDDVWIFDHALNMGEIHCLSEGSVCPEPTSLVLLTLGSSGLVLKRRRKPQQARGSSRAEHCWDVLHLVPREGGQF